MGSPCFYCKNRRIGCHDECSKYQTFRNRIEKRDFKTENEFYEYTESAVKRMGSEGRRI